MLTKWESESENQDGTGGTYYRCQCPTRGAGQVRLEHLYELCYSPDENKMWFWDAMREESDVIRMTCSDWEQAEMVKAMLTDGKSHWMEV